MKFWHKTRYQVVLLMLLLLTAAAILLLGLNANEKRHNQLLYNELVAQQQQLFAAVYRLDGESQANLAADYSYWDDMVSFAKKPTKSFADNNLVTALGTYQVNAIWVYNSGAVQVYSTNNLHLAKLDLTLTGAQISQLFTKSPMAHFFVRSDQGIVEIRGATIHPSNDPRRLGSEMGYLFVGRSYDPGYRQRLGANAKSNISLVGLGSVPSPKPSTGQVVTTKSLTDFQGNTLAQLVSTADAPTIRELYLQSTRRLQNYLEIVIPTLLILLWILTRTVTDPLRKISATLASRDPSHLDGLITSKSEFGEIASLLAEDFRANRQQLEAAHARLRASINSINIGFIMTDARAKVIMVNDAARRILFNDVRRAKEVKLEEVTQLLPKTELKRTIDHAIATTTSHSLGEVAFLDKFLRIFVAPVTEAPGKPPVLGSIVLFEDVTLERGLKRARDEFFSIASHELRTPLTVIMGNAAMIEENIVPAAKDQELGAMIKDIYDSSKRLIQMVNDFLDTSRLEQNRIKFELATVDLVQLLKQITKEYSHVVEQQGLKLKLEILAAEASVKVRADQDKLRQVLINLLSNAVTFTHQGSITLRLESHPDYARIFVNDTGEGIPPGRFHLLFKKFQQAEENILSRNPTKDFQPGATRDTTHGTGLGLYISKLLMEGMGGLIRLENSEAGKGTSFSLTLPTAGPSNLKKGTTNVKKTATD